MGPVCERYEVTRDPVSCFNESNMSANMGDCGEEYSNIGPAMDYTAGDLLGRESKNLE